MKGLNRKRFQRGQVDVTSILFFSHVNFEGLKLNYLFTYYAVFIKIMWFLVIKKKKKALDRKESLQLKIKCRLLIASTVLGGVRKSKSAHRPNTGFQHWRNGKCRLPDHFWPGKETNEST